MADLGGKTVRGLAIVVGVIGLLSTTGCSTIGEAVSTYNPFAKKEKPLTGERKQILAATDPVADFDGLAKPVSVGAAQLNAEWAQPGGNAANDPGHLALSGGGTWRNKTGSVGSGNRVQITAAPIVYQGRVFAYDPDGNVSAHSLGNGGRLWQVSLKPEKERSSTAGGGIAAADGRVFAATGYRQIVALDAASGRQLWAKDIDDPARGAPTVAGGKIYFVSANEKVYALNAADGEEAWSFRGIPESAGVLSNASPAVSGSIVVVPYSSGEIVSFDAASGKVKWLDTVVRGARTSAVAGLNDVAARPVVSGGVVYATGISGRTIA
ncbi:MAG: PQQ-like beta-propeller repeat protein, partial [Hyphomicrobiales bacterium]|nr:PQQ-like beta-propeller repeat protein [Hyphomicrobiales bacterium]